MLLLLRRRPQQQTQQQEGLRPAQRMRRSWGILGQVMRFSGNKRLERI
jgi:hypothetical protein